MHPATGRRAALYLDRRIAAAATVKTAKSDVDLLRRALAYFGTPDERLDLYRLFGMDLPPPEGREFKD
jgi:hypothetical protein